MKIFLILTAWNNPEKKFDSLIVDPKSSLKSVIVPLNMGRGRLTGHRWIASDNEGDEVLQPLMSDYQGDYIGLFA